MAAKIFISYRRDDSAGYAGRVHDQLVEKLGSNVFMDVDGIPLGSNFVKALNDEVAKCSALLAVIGPDWLDARDKKGQRRLDNPHDFVRVEIGAALNRQIPVIPILLEGTTIPSADQLPSDLQELSLRNGIYVHHDSFRNDMDRLVLGLKAQLRGGNWRDILSSARDERTDRAGPGWTKRALLAATCTAGTAAAVAYLIKIIGDDENRQEKPSPPPPQTTRTSPPTTTANQLPIDAQVQRLLAGSNLADRLITVMERKGFQVDRGLGEVNIVYVEGMNPDGTANANEANKWNDLRLLIRFDGGEPRIIGKWAATTEPGQYWTQNPVSALGAARIEFGQYRAWQVGMHRNDQEALVQTGGEVTVCRDLNKDGQRTGDKRETGEFNIDQHWGYDLPEVHRASAGSLVGQSKDGHLQFMALVKSDPRYQANRKYVFATTILPASEIVSSGR